MLGPEIVFLTNDPENDGNGLRAGVDKIKGLKVFLAL